MPVDRTLFSEPFYIDYLPAWPCSRCGRGHLKFIEKWDTLQRSCADFRRLSLDEYEDFEQDRGVVALIAQCSFEECKESFSINGTYHTAMAFDQDGQEYDIAICIPLTIIPPIHPIKIIKQCPAEVREQLIESFSLMWINANAALNRVRTALELIMDNFSVPRAKVVQDKNGKRKRRRLDLHNRIEKLGTQRKSTAGLIQKLLAVKYLGNDGTHDTTATFDDFSDAVDLMEELLACLFDASHVSNETIATEVMKQKGRRKKKK